MLKISVPFCHADAGLDLSQVDSYERHSQEEQATKPKYCTENDL